MTSRLRLSTFFLLNFILIEVIIVGVGGTVAYHLGRNNLIRVAEQNSVAVAGHLANVVDELYMKPWGLTFETFPYDNAIAYTELSGIILNFLGGFNVERVNIFDSKYRVLFSTDSTLIGNVMPDNAELRGALAGAPHSSLELQGDAPDVPGTGRSRDYLETYIPVDVRGADGRTSRVAFEIYLDITATFLKVRELRSVILVSTTCIGIALLIAVLLIARRAEWLLGRENRERVALAEQIRQQNEQLETIVAQRTRQLRDAQADLVQMEKMAATGQLAAGVAHEINNPVSIIQNRLELLLEDLRDARAIPDLPEHLTMLHKHTERISRIVGRLLSFARKSGTGKSAVTLDGILQSVLALVRKEIEKRGIVLVTDVTAGLPPLRGNSTELEQVFINLLLNAMDATPSGGRIELSVAQDRETLRAVVRDTGAGISPAHLPRIFDPFFTTKDVGVGTGLGLSITYRIVEDHGGRIDVNSAPGTGTAFTLTFPILAAGDAEA